MHKTPNTRCCPPPGLGYQPYPHTAPREFIPKSEKICVLGYKCTQKSVWYRPRSDTLPQNNHAKIHTKIHTKIRTKDHVRIRTKIHVKNHAKDHVKNHAKNSRRSLHHTLEVAEWGSSWIAAQDINLHLQTLVRKRKTLDRIPQKAVLTSNCVCLFAVTIIYYLLSRLYTICCHNYILCLSFVQAPKQEQFSIQYSVFSCIFE